MQHATAQLNFHHNFTEPVRIADTNLFYDPMKVDRLLTRILSEKEEPNASPRNTSAPGC
jgi:hypothetical protein